MARSSKTPTEGTRKSEIVTVRLDPRLKYLAELAARRQRRPLSSYIEWAVAASLHHVRAAYDPDRQGPETFADEADALWDIDERDRFAKLALRYPDLLGVEEQRLWKLIRECGYLWRGHFEYEGSEGVWTWRIDERGLIWERLHEHWDTFRKVASGEIDHSALPNWTKRRTKTQEEIDADVPF